MVMDALIRVQKDTGGWGEGEGGLGVGKEQSPVVRQCYHFFSYGDMQHGIKVIEV